MTLVADMADIDASLLEDLGEPMMFEGSSIPVFGIFNDSYLVQQGGENVVEGRAILFTCRAADLPSLAEGAVITRVHDASSYRYLSRTSSDEAGLVNLHLGSVTTL